MKKRVGMSKNQKAQQNKPRAGSETPNVAEVPVNHYHGEPAILSLLSGIKFILNFRHPMTGYGQLNRQNISNLILRGNDAELTRCFLTFSSVLFDINNNLKPEFITFLYPGLTGGVRLDAGRKP